MTVAQVLTRDDFRKRWDAGAPISLHELLYPLAQGYDSVAIEADIEMGGQDQTFNILTGRDLQAESGQDQQIGFFMPLLVGLDGQKKMSKSLGNYVGIAEPAIDQYSKVMSLADELMGDWFLLCTDVPVETYSEWLAAGSNPMDAKHKLAHAIVEIYHGLESADAASEQWKKVHSGRQFPDDAPEHTVSSNPIAPVALLVELGVCASNGDARRLVEQGGLSINGEKHSDTKTLVNVTSGDQLKAGKKHYFVLRTA